MPWDLAEAVSVTTFRVWENNIGNGGIKDFFKGGGGIKEGGLFEKGGINTLCELCLNILKMEHNFSTK